MGIPVQEATKAPPVNRTVSWVERDVILYHLSLGAGMADRGPELSYTYESALRVLPTFAMVAGQGISSGAPPVMPLDRLGIEVDMRNLLHVGQALDVYGPIPPAGAAIIETSVPAVWDKGRAAIVVIEEKATDPDGRPLWTATFQMWVSGQGGFGGDPGPSPARRHPEDDPDLVFETATGPGQALLYRLNGDLNPLHIDPAFAVAAGLKRPILHGLASFGIVAKGLVDHLLDGDPTRLRRLEVRFAGVVHPGETLRTRVWRRGGELTFATDCPEHEGAPVLSHATAQTAV